MPEPRNANVKSSDYRQAAEDFVANVLREAYGAAGKFPRNEHQITALGEEVGELCNALLENHRGKLPAQKVYDEAVQVAGMALRVALEGSAEFFYDYTPMFAAAFKPTNGIARNDEWLHQLQQAGLLPYYATADDGSQVPPPPSYYTDGLMVQAPHRPAEP